MEEKTLLILLTIIHCCCANWEFQLLLHHYNNPTSTAFNTEFTELNANQKCCDLEFPSSTCTDQCDNIFDIALSPLDCQSHNLSCSYDHYITDVFKNNDHIQFTQIINGGVNNPLVFKADIWPMNSIVLLAVLVNDYDSGSTNDLVDMMVIVVPVSVSSGFTPVQNITGYYNYSTISISYKMTCTDNYSGTYCNETNRINQATTRLLTESCVGPTSTSTVVSSISTNSRSFVIVIIFGALLLLLIIVTIISCCIIVMLCRKVRQRTITGRPLPKPPSTTDQMILYNCPAYEQIDIDDDDDDEMIN